MTALVSIARREFEPDLLHGDKRRPIMARLFRIIAVLLAITLYIGDLVGAQRAAAFDSPHRSSNSGRIRFLSIIDSIPHQPAGAVEQTAVPDDTLFAVLIESRLAINLAETGSIRFSIDDGIHHVYRRDLGSDAVRVVRVAGADPPKTLLWAVYERSLESFLPPVYLPDTVVHIGVEVGDVARNRLSRQHFRFTIEPEPGNLVDFNRLPDYEFMESDEFSPEGVYNSGIEILSGQLQGARIIYNHQEPLTPGFGPLDEIEALNLADSQGVGVPLNLLPHTVFNAPVKLFIPFPEDSDIEQMDIFYHNGTRWLPACDSSGKVLPDGIGWMVPGSRINHSQNIPPLVEIQVYHFSAAQGGFVVASTGTSRDHDHSSQSGTVVFVKCFIETGVQEASLTAFDHAALPWVFGMLSFLTIWYGFRRIKVSMQLDALD